MAEDPIEQAVKTAAALNEIALQPDWLAAATASLRTVAAAAALVQDFPLEDEADYAPVFRA